MDAYTDRIHIGVAAKALAVVCFAGADAAELDPVVYNRAATFTYLDRVRAAVGEETFIKVKIRDAIAAAEMLGKHERKIIPPETFHAHVCKAVEIRETSPYAERAPTELWKLYGLPLRLRGERFRNAGWLVPVSEKFAEVVDGETDVRGVSARIFEWVEENIETGEETLQHGLRERGDLDPLTVLRGRWGRPSDVSLATIGALRSVGLLARLIYCPNTLGTGGELTWVEYLGPDGEWIAWVPGFEGVPLDQHAGEIRKRFEGELPVVLADPFVKEDVTGRYVSVWRPGFPLRARSGAKMFSAIQIIGGGALTQAAGAEFDWGSGPGGLDLPVGVSSGILVDKEKGDGAVFLKGLTFSGE